MQVALYPLAVLDTETGEYHTLRVSLLPEYHAREAARFASTAWGDFIAMKPPDFMNAVAHYIAQRLFTAHEADAVRLRQEQDMARGRANRGA